MQPHNAGDRLVVQRRVPSPVSGTAGTSALCRLPEWSPAVTVPAPVRRAVVVVAGIAVLVVSSARTALAQVVPDPAPDPSLPGGALITQVLGWLKYGAIAAAVAGLLIGGITVGVGHFGSNYNASSAGRKWLLGGIGAAMIAGLAHVIAVTVYNAS